uniref:Uncharacterized protein n=1 Tax=Hyaloperonospora arabidopsidis (strain Emoy2) TaxID=559515 RepID=M4BRH1_HYAAE
MKGDRLDHRQTPPHTHTYTHISTIKKFGIQPCAQSRIAAPFGLAITSSRFRSSHPVFPLSHVTQEVRAESQACACVPDAYTNTNSASMFSTGKPIRAYHLIRAYDLGGSDCLLWLLITNKKSGRVVTTSCHLP